ncbi:sulfotransferase family 2 domain-containing protein [Histidinibacterium aquaticum]|uniref:Sulfotransferase family protein n=1 Tax=Histidinibacterium aquaticum TaxID=2613962 RepID=A0A5J5GPE3_9RHOB|nr:sulfotransferase family 2 domain-containing protein [Histidinibacterium aquaticum]KAA9009312.1 sulfotransferase family protein [Histidinibacterium aquaticum]
MLVFWKEKLVFLAVPKTGTTALEGALAPHASMVIRDPPELKHSAVYRYRRWLEPFFEKAGRQSMETMAVVRHPVDWLKSWYKYRHRPALEGHRNSTRGMDFDTFVSDYCRDTRPAHAAVGSQAKFLLGKDGALGVDHLFRYEEPEPLMDFLEARLGVRPETKRLNVSPAMELELAPGVEERLRRKCPEEFRVWEMGATRG